MGCCTAANTKPKDPREGIKLKKAERKSKHVPPGLGVEDAAAGVPGAANGRKSNLAGL